MNERVKHILNEASLLSDDDRVALTSALMDSLRPTDEAAAADWRTEIASRFEAYSRGELSTEDADDVLSEARKSLLR